MRRGDRRPVAGADHRPADDPRRRAAVHGDGPGRARTQGRVREAARADAARGLFAGQGRRRAAPPRRGDRPRQEVQARHLDRRRPAGDEAGPPPPPLGVGRGGGCARRRPGRGRADRRGRFRGRADAVLGEVRLPQLRHLDPRARAADLLLQLAARGLRALPRPRLPAGHRPRASRPGPDPLAGRRGAAALAPRALALLEAGGRGGRRGQRDRRRHSLAGALRRRAGGLSARHRRGAIPGQLPQPLRAPPLLRGPLRGDPLQPRAPLRGHRLGEGPRADRGLHGRAALPGMPGSAAAPGEPLGDDWRDQHPRVLRAFGPRRARVDRGAGADRHRAGDRAPDRARGERAALLPRQRRDRLSQPRPRGPHALRRRGAADPACDPDRIEPGRRPLHPRRALDRFAPARQREADRDPRAAARSRQHGDRGRARRGHDALGRSHRRPRAGRRRARGTRRRRGDAGRDPVRARVADGPVPQGRAQHRSSPSSGASRAGSWWSAAPASTT